MNAYELADDLESYDWYYEHEVTGSDGFTQEIKTCNTEYVWDAASMLRQQADRIAELEKQGEPVAWMEYIQDEEWEVWYTEPTDLPEGHSYKPLYLAPQTKPLSDEEIEKVFDNTFKVRDFDGEFLRFARAIEERHGIK